MRNGNPLIDGGKRRGWCSKGGKTAVKNQFQGLADRNVTQETPAK